MKKLLLFILLFPLILLGQEVEVRIVDVGAGLCAIIKLPDNKFIIYDAGNKTRAIPQIDEMLDEKSEVEMLILSHTDDDHWGAAAHIVNKYTVKSVLKTDYKYEKNDYTISYKEGVKAMDKKKVKKIKLSDLKLGEVLYDEGGIKLEFICGFEEPPAEWGNLGSSKLNNGVSIVVKLIVGEKSILFCGDAVGKDDDFKNKKCTSRDESIATEKFMLENIKKDLKSDVIIAPHHGGDNASSQEFIEAVKPKYVVFSCGDKHVHPRDITVKRYVAFGVDEKNMFRTDYADKAEGGTLGCNKEWKQPRRSRKKDKSDDVQIILKEDRVKIQYLFSQE